MENNNKKAFKHKYCKQEYKIKMPSYNCDICDYETTHKASFERHQKTSKHLSNIEVQKSHPINTPLSPQCHPHTCKYCNKEFSHKQSKYYHMKYSCKEKEELNTSKELLSLKEEVDEKDKNYKFLEQLCEKQKTHIEGLNTLINNLMSIIMAQNM
jgi:hypothetical protein